MPSRRALLQTVASTTAGVGLAGCSLSTASGPDAAAWHASVGGATTLSGPAVADGTVATLGSREDDYKNGRVDAFEIETGERLWTVDVGRPTGLAMDGDAVYAGVKTSQTTAEVIALDAATGDERWRRTVHNLASALAVADGMVYAANGTLAALDVTDGTIRWEVDQRAGADFPIVAAASDQLTAGGGQVVYGDNDGVVALAATDASVDWRWRPEEWGSTYSGPVLTADRVFVGSDDEQGAVALDRADGTTQWTHSFGERARVAGIHPYEGGVVVGTGTGYDTNGFGTVYRLAADGSEQREVRLAAPVATADGRGERFVVATRDGTVVGFDARAIAIEPWRATLEDTALVATDGERGFAQTGSGDLWMLTGA